MDAATNVAGENTTAFQGQKGIWKGTSALQQVLPSSEGMAKGTRTITMGTRKAASPASIKETRRGCGELLWACSPQVSGRPLKTQSQGHFPEATFPDIMAALSPLTQGHAH